MEGGESGSGMDPGLEREAVCDFLEQWHEDQAAGHARDLAYYLARFPDAQEAVAREYLLRTDGGVVPNELGSTVGGAKGERGADHDADRYERQGEIARGGMGLVERVRDRRLDRDLARKSALRTGVDARMRFELEARLTGQLDHPGIVPVHDVGVDGRGVPWFTMRLVGGRDLREIIQLVHAGDTTWSMTAALGVLLRVCETAAYAHSRGVVHRDIKAANVRVGQFGEVYVLDWGLARREHEPEVHDLRLRHGRTSSTSALQTMDGAVIGTPCAMPPEQAAGRVEEVGPRSDVYSVGALLYELLAGRMPYLAPGESVPSTQVLERVLLGPPTPLTALIPDASPELVAICQKAMEREPGHRYPDMRAMAADLRAYLEGRVVRAYRTGVRAEVGKWIARNRTLASVLGVAFALGVLALATLLRASSVERQRLRLQADTRAPADLVARAASLCTGQPSDAPRLRLWLGEARDLSAHIPAYRRELERLRARSLLWDQSSPRELEVREARAARVAGFDRLIDYYERELEAMQRESRRSEEGQTEEAVSERLMMIAHDRAVAEARPIERQTYTFATRRDADRHAMIERLLVDVAPLVDGDDREGLLSLMERRLATVEALDQQTLVEAASSWARAITSIADSEACPRYESLRIQPQLGLVPLRRDPTSGLWEFLHVASGAAPQLGSGGQWLVTDDTGIVLVLVPGVIVELGAQATDTRVANYDPAAEANEWRRGQDGPELVRAILAPYFVGKYEVTQSQWRRIAGVNPAYYQPGASAAVREAYSKTDPPTSAIALETHPVETVDWHVACDQLQAVGLTLPSEAQWEYVARAGSTTPWSSGLERSSVFRVANLADMRYARHYREQYREDIAAEPYDDGFPLHAPVGSFLPNAFGLYDTAGNVNEWCLDSGFISYDKQIDVLIDTSERRLWGEGLRVRRGGSFTQSATLARSAARQFNGPEYTGSDTGARAARGLVVTKDAK